MRKIFTKVKAYALAHKIIASVVALAVLYGAYSGYRALTSTAGETSYVLANAEVGTVVSSVSGTGQVSASNEVDIKPKASGDIVYIGVKPGQVVKQGTLIAQLDTTDATKAVRDAQLNLDSAQLSLQKTQAPADTLSVTQAQNAVAQAQDDLAKAYDSGFNNTADTFVDLPTLMAGLNDILYGTTVGTTAGQSNIAAYVDRVRSYDDSILDRRADVEAKYNAARASYEKATIDYKSISRLSDKTAIENFISETYTTTKLISDSINATNTFLSSVKDTLTQHNVNIPSQLATQQTTLGTYTNTVNGHLTDLYGNISSLTSGRRSIDEKTQSLAKLKAGADPLDVQSSELTITQRQNALLDAKNALANYYVRAPFDGTIASLPAKKGDSASSGTALATIITKQKIAEITLNEVDIAKVQVGQKVTLTFDALPDITLAGEVAEIDSVGTVSQGVVTYAVKIDFDSDTDAIKPGMSVSAAIVTAVKQDVLTVPTSAVKTTNGVSRVQVVDGTYTDAEAAAGIVSKTPPREVMVTTGLSDDTSIEIVSGLTEGDHVVTRSTVVGATAATAQTNAPSLLGGGAARGGAVGGTRVIGR